MLYAIGNVNESQESDSEPVIEKITTKEFVFRIAKYLRSIGLYGDNPMLMANYGSSEYTQSLSRVGSLFGCLYVISAKDWDIEEINRE